MARRPNTGIISIPKPPTRVRTKPPTRVRSGGNDGYIIGPTDMVYRYSDLPKLKEQAAQNPMMARMLGDIISRLEAKDFDGTGDPIGNRKVEKPPVKQPPIPDSDKGPYGNFTVGGGTAGLTDPRLSIEEKIEQVISGPSFPGRQTPKAINPPVRIPEPAGPTIGTKTMPAEGIIALPNTYKKTPPRVNIEQRKPTVNPVPAQGPATPPSPPVNDTVGIMPITAPRGPVQGGAVRNEEMIFPTINQGQPPATPPSPPANDTVGIMPITAPRGPVQGGTVTNQAQADAGGQGQPPALPAMTFPSLSDDIIDIMPIDDLDRGPVQGGIVVDPNLVTVDEIMPTPALGASGASGGKGRGVDEDRTGLQAPETLTAGEMEGVSGGTGLQAPEIPTAGEMEGVSGGTSLLDRLQKMIEDIQAQQFEQQEQRQAQRQEQEAQRQEQEARMASGYTMPVGPYGYNPYQSGQYQSDPYGISGVPNMGGITTIPLPYGGYGIYNPIYSR